MEIKTDEEIFRELEGKAQVSNENVKKDMLKGEIGDDFIGFDFSDDENEVERNDSDNESGDEDNGKSGGKRSHSARHEDHDSKKVNLSEEVKKKLGRLFHPRAPWFPLNFSNRELAEHYGYLSAPSSRRKHFSERLHQELNDLARYLSPTKAEEAARALVVRKCDAVVKKLFPGNKVECFGSFETGLYLPTSDIDLVVIPDLKNNGDSSDSILDDSDRPPPLRKLARALIKAGIADPRSVQVIAKARVPIIKFVDKLTGHDVDISFNVASGLDGARFLKEQLQLYPALKPLLLFVKLFLDLRGLNEVFRGGLGSFSAACLLISFFQLHPLIQLGYIRAEDNLGVLLLEFLELYGKLLYYEKVGISVGLDRNSAEIKGFSDESLVSAIDVPYGYYDKMDRGFYNEARPGLLSIQDPQSPSNDLARPSFSISSVRQAFEHAFNLLTAAAHEIDSADSKHQNFHNHHRTDGSLLAALINIPDSFLKHRDYIKRTIIPK